MPHFATIGAYLQLQIELTCCINSAFKFDARPRKIVVLSTVLPCGTGSAMHDTSVTSSVCIMTHLLRGILALTMIGLDRTKKSDFRSDRLLTICPNRQLNDADPPVFAGTSASRISLEAVILNRYLLRDERYGYRSLRELSFRDVGESQDTSVKTVLEDT